MHKIHRRLGVAVAAAVLGASATATALSAAEPGSLIVIVDGSGSMAGQLEGGDGETKINLVREALRPSLARVGPRIRVGLASFGAGSNSCSRADVIRTPAPIEIEPMMAQLDQIRPRGRGPFTLALREAAKQLPEGSGQRSVLLIHDGDDNCRRDLCEAADELSAAGITAHVVSVGTGAEDLAKVACLPEATGGRHFKAENAEQLAAFIGEALRLVGNRAAVAGFTTTIVPPAPIPARGPAALHLRAVLAGNTQPLSVPLHWIVSTEDRPDAAVFEAWAAHPVVRVEPGRYVVEVGNGLISGRESVIVRKDRPVAVPVALGAGVVRVRAVAERTGAPLPGAIVTISAGKDGPPVAVFKAGETAALLPAGRFTVRAELGLVRAGPQALEVAAGRSIGVDIPLNAGRLQLATAGRDGIMPLQAPVFIVTEDDPPRGRREVARSAARQAEFVLPPGTYYVVARQGGVEAHERLVVGSGDVERRTLTVPAGRLSLSSASTGPGALDEDLVSYTIQRIDDPGQEAIDTSRPAPVLFLPSGRYRIEGRYGLTNVRTVREIDIREGEHLELLLEHRIGELRLRLADAGAATEVSWEVRDEAGRTVWTSDRIETVATLQAGRYLIAARTREGREERAVELSAGESVLVEIRGD